MCFKWFNFCEELQQATSELVWQVFFYNVKSKKMAAVLKTYLNIYLDKD